MNAADRTEQSAQIDRAAVHVRAAELNAARAGMMAHRGDTEAARHFASDSKTASGRALAVLCGSLGATMPPVQEGGQVIGPQSGPLDLNALATIEANEPDARAVLELLTQAQAIAEQIDARNGHVLPSHIPTGPNESRGTNYAEDISMLAARLRGEIFGASGAGRE